MSGNPPRRRARISFGTQRSRPDTAGVPTASFSQVNAQTAPVRYGVRHIGDIDDIMFSTVVFKFLGPVDIWNVVLTCVRFSKLQPTQQQQEMIRRLVWQCKELAPSPKDLPWSHLHGKQCVEGLRWSSMLKLCVDILCKPLQIERENEVIYINPKQTVIYIDCEETKYVDPDDFRDISNHALRRINRIHAVIPNDTRGISVDYLQKICAMVDVSMGVVKLLIASFDEESLVPKRYNCSMLQDILCRELFHPKWVGPLTRLVGGFLDARSDVLGTDFMTSVWVHEGEYLKFEVTHPLNQCKNPMLKC